MKSRRLSLGQAKHHKGLPNNFQEVIILAELQLKKEKSAALITKLSFLYSLAIEHYDSVCQNELMAYYSRKMNEMLMMEGVTELLEKNDRKAVSFTNDALYKEIFGDEQEGGRAHRNSLSFLPIERIETMASLPLSTSESNKNAKTHMTSLDKSRINDIVEDKISSSNREAKNIAEELSNDLVKQKVIFEERKRKKRIEMNKQRLLMIKQSICEINSGEGEKKDKPLFWNKKSTSILSCKEQNIDRLSNPFKRQLSVGNTQMISEIEAAIDRNIKEMYRALDELRESYDAEIKAFEANKLNEFALCLNEERDEAIENLKFQFEEQRDRETDLIKKKYKLNKGD